MVWKKNIINENITTRDRKFRALEKSPGPGAPGEIGNINPPAPGTPAFKILTPDRGPRGRGIHNICIILEFYLEKKNPISNQFGQKTNLRGMFDEIVKSVKVYVKFLKNIKFFKENVKIFAVIFHFLDKNLLNKPPENPGVFRAKIPRPRVFGK